MLKFVDHVLTFLTRRTRFQRELVPTTHSAIRTTNRMRKCQCKGNDNDVKLKDINDRFVDQMMLRAIKGFLPAPYVYRADPLIPLVGYDGYCILVGHTLPFATIYKSENLVDWEVYARNTKLFMVANGTAHFCAKLDGYEDSAIISFTNSKTSIIKSAGSGPTVVMGFSGITAEIGEPTAVTRVPPGAPVCHMTDRYFNANAKPAEDTPRAEAEAVAQPKPELSVGLHKAKVKRARPAKKSLPKQKSRPKRKSK